VFGICFQKTLDGKDCSHLSGTLEASLQWEVLKMQAAGFARLLVSGLIFIGASLCEV
jgi:hypothetical protein